MAKNETKTKAELYREERKERIAKANKKNAKNIEKGKAAASVGKKIVAVVVILAILAGVGYYLFANTGIVTKNVTALKVGDAKISATDYNFYYSSAYQQTSYYAEMYSQYGMDMGFSSAVSPREQTTTGEDGESITWAEAFKDTAKSNAQFVEAYYAEAMKNDFKLDDDIKAEIDETIENYKSTASESGYSLNAYLKASFGGGFTEKTFRTLLEKQEVASHYYQSQQEAYNEGIKAEDIEKEYKENGKLYDYVDIVYYAINGETLQAEENETEKELKARQDKADKEVAKKADKLYDSVTDVKSLIEGAKKLADSKEDVTTELKATSHSTISSSINDKAADWAFDAARKAGDKTCIKDGSKAFVVVLTKKAYTSNSVDFRLCLVNVEAAGDEATDEEKKAAKTEADEILKEFKAGDKKEASFEAICIEKSDDTSVADTNGLYEGARITDGYDEKVNAWLFDSARKAGDTKVIETEGACYVVYFVKNNADDLDWKAAIRSNLGEAAFNEYDKGILAEDGDYVVDANDKWCTYVSDKFCKKIEKNLAYSANSQQQ